MNKDLDKEFAKALYEFLVKVNAPFEWLTSSTIDLDDLFVKLRNNGHINDETYNKLNYAITYEKPTH